MDIDDIKYRLNSINWNFDFSINYSLDSLYPFDCRKHYSYPATFIPEIPYTLIEILSNKGDTVLDPFGGIGTTFIQSLLLERFPFSCDINPVSTDVCSRLYNILNPNYDRDLLKQKLFDLCDYFDEQCDYTNSITEHQKTLEDWYEPKTFNRLCYLICQYNLIKDSEIKNALGLIVSSILVTLSSQNKGWAYIADNVKPKKDEYKEKPVFDIYKTRVKVLFTDIDNHIKNESKSFSTFYNKAKEVDRVFNASVLDVDIPKIDLVVTSPPYPKMIDYVKSQRMVLDFLNKNYNDYISKEIGARCKRARKDALNEYKSIMYKINKHICELLKPNGFICLILPDYPKEDSRKTIIDETIKSYNAYGLELIGDFKRYIPSNRRTISIQWASLVNEKIFVFRKEK